MTAVPVALSIAGSDSGGGAGILADTKTFAACGVWATAAITAVTAQNTIGVHHVTLVDPEMVAAQIDAVCADLRVVAVKTGMLGSGRIVAAVAQAVRRHRLSSLVIDPVAIASSGATLLDADGLERMLAELIPLAALVTPNLDEASALSGLDVRSPQQMEAAGRAILTHGCQAVLVTGGHLSGERAADCLVREGEPVVWLDGPRIAGAGARGSGAHGSGCVLSAAICAGLALGLEMEDACRQGKAFVTDALRSAVDLGAGAPAANPAASWRA